MTYDEYWDYVIGFTGIDPSDYDNFDDYWAAVLELARPVNYDAFGPDGQLGIEKHGEPRYEDALEDFHDAIAQAKANFYVRGRTKIASRQFRIRYGKVSKARVKGLAEIERARLDKSTKISKAARKVLRSSIFLRAHELQEKFGYDRSKSLKRAHKELGL